ncbi:MAG: hypothetical protein K6A63_00110, partial [Acholeplasmatales bacterium]|nr:hypothetical protein [Acholeplasmatales bacterium]
VETLEKEALTREKNFDTNQLALRKQNERTIDTLLSGNPTPEAYEQVAALQRNYQNSLINHCNILKDDLDKGFISEGFYRKRIEQVMAGEPVGKLKFFGSTVAVKEEEYIKEAIENNKSREAAKLEYDSLVARLNNEKQTMAFRLAKKDNRIFKDLNVKKPEYGFNKYETISLEAEENRAFEHNYVVPNEVNIENHEGGIHILDDNSSEARYHMPSRLNAQNNEEVDIYKVLEDNPDEFDNRIEDPKDVYKKKVSIDIGENDNHSKSEFIEEDEKDLVNEKGSVIDNKVKEI